MWSGFRRFRALNWNRFNPSRGFSAIAWSTLFLLLALVIIPVVIAQSRRPAPLPPGLVSAERALIEGKYDDVASLTSSLDPQDPNVAAVRARALIARGQYQEAETLLRPAAGRAPTSEAALQLGLLLDMLGRSEAPAILARMAAASSSNDPKELGRAGRALRALGRSYDANAVYRDAVGLAPKDPALNTGWGELFLDTHQPNEAIKSFRDALEVDEKYAPALFGAARALAGDDPPQANAAALKALEINPSDVAVHVFLADQAIDAGKREEARQILEKALAINPASLEALSLRTGLDYVEDKQSDFDAGVTRVLSIAPRHGEVYRMAGELAARNYRFDEAVSLVRRALELDSSSAHSLGDLGVHLLRTGDEPTARRSLEASFKLDPFDVVTYNLLQMMDTLDKFVTVEDGDVVMRMHPDEAPLLLQDYAMPLAHQALTTLSKRYGFSPKGPTLVEVFPKHDDFAVRNVGLPGMIGALGACFGRVVTMDSPKARPPGEFQWEATLWHELAHVITLQMSNQRLPRWLSEGISVYEESLARPEWGRSQEMTFAGMMNAGEVIKLKDLNAAFQNPRLISIAYFQASVLVDYLFKTFGDEGMHKLLRAYGKGLETDDAMKEAFNTTLGSLQGGFDEVIEKRFGALSRAIKLPEEAKDVRRAPMETLQVLAAKYPDNFPIQLTYGNRLVEDGKKDEALKVFEHAAVLAPVALGDDNPNLHIAQIALENKDNARALTALQAVLQTDFDNVEAARLLARVMRDAKVTDPAQTRPVYERIIAIDPFDADAHATLGRIALGRDDAQTAIREFRAVIALKPVDQAAAYTDLAEGYFKAGRRADARKQTLTALEIAPSYERAQDLLLQLSGIKP